MRLIAVSILAFFTLALGAQAAPQGTTLTFVDTFWRCQQPLSNYGPLPLTVHMTFSPGKVVVPPGGAGIVQLGQGCSGPGKDGVVDLILDVQGDGLTYGGGDDAIRFMRATPGVRDMDIAGHADCGPRQGSAHQDGIQILGGTNVALLDFEIGDYANGRSTCQGAGGSLFYSESSTNVDAFGGRYIACNHSLFAGVSSPGAEVRDASFRSGHAANVYGEAFAVEKMLVPSLEIARAIYPKPNPPPGGGGGGGSVSSLSSRSTQPGSAG